MSTKQEAIVAEFLETWNQGMEAMKQGYRDHFANDAVWEQSGIPTTNGIDEAIGFLDATEKAVNVTKISVELLHIASVGDIVLTERYDALWRADGSKITDGKVAGVFEIDSEGKIAKWREYFDPTAGQASGSY